MFNITSTIEQVTGNGGNGGGLFLILGAVATSMSGTITSAIYSVLGYIYTMSFSSIQLDEEEDDSADFVITEGLYEHILNHRSSFQGWNIRMAKNSFGVEKSDIHNHRFVLQNGNVLFWNWSGWFPHLYYAEYTRGGKGWWQTSSLMIKFLRISGWDIIRLLEEKSKNTDEKHPINYAWALFGNGDNFKWTPDKCREKYVQNPPYISTPDIESVLERADMSIKSWTIENEYVKAFNAGRYILYGPPGTGKTSIPRLLAWKYGMNIYRITQHELHADTLKKMVASLPENSILLFDDLDLSILDEKDEDDQNKDTRSRRRARGRDLKSVIKSVFGGTVIFPPGCLVFITTNDEKLDISITSRFIPFYIGYAPSEWYRKIFQFVCKEDTKGVYSEMFQEQIGESKISQRIVTESLAVSYASEEGVPEKVFQKTLELLKPYLPSSPPPFEEETEEKKEEGEVNMEKEEKEEKRVLTPPISPMISCFMTI